jgi:hypothetical protein
VGQHVRVGAAQSHKKRWLTSASSRRLQVYRLQFPYRFACRPRHKRGVQRCFGLTRVAV